MKRRSMVCLCGLFSIWALLAIPAGAAELSFNTQDFAPFNYQVNGVVSGPAADVIRKVCGEMKIECPMTLLPWRRAQQEVEGGKVNGMFVIGWNADVKGYVVGVFGPSNTATALRKIKAELQDLTIDMTPDDLAAFKKLSLGRVQAVFSNRDVGYDVMRRLGIANVRYAGRQQPSSTTSGSPRSSPTRSSSTTSTRRSGACTSRASSSRC